MTACLAERVPTDFTATDWLRHRGRDNQSGTMTGALTR